MECNHRLEIGHNHFDCDSHYSGCQEGIIWGFCDDGEGYCPAPDCVILGHCTCKCHTGRVCILGCEHTYG